MAMISANALSRSRISVRTSCSPLELCDAKYTALPCEYKWRRRALPGSKMARLTGPALAHRLPTSHGLAHPPATMSCLCPGRILRIPQPWWEAVGMFRAFGAACVLQAAIVSIAQAAGPFGSINVGVWKGGAYTNDATGKFSHCAAGAAYTSGVSLIISQTATNSWLVG